MTDTGKHTALPISCAKATGTAASDQVAVYYLYDARAEVIGEIYGRDRAEDFVTAVNSHDALLAQIEELREAAQRVCNAFHLDSKDILTDAVIELRNALAASKGEA